MLFTGEPGIGKSRLAEQVAAEASASGAVTAFGRCWEAGGAPAYWPWIQVFRALQRGDDPFADAGTALAVGGAEARFALFDRAVQRLRALSARRPLAIVLDDLHAADPASLLLLLLLARELPRSAILLVGAYREAELRLHPERAPLLAKIAREAELVPLARLAPADITAWLRDADVMLGPECEAELYRATEGLPLFVNEALRRVRAGRTSASPLPDLGALLDEHLGLLSPATRAVLEVAGVLGREFALREVVAVADLPRDHVHAALEEALAMSVVVRDDGAERFRFAHVLLRDRLDAELAPSRRSALHARAGEAILGLRANPQVAAHHLLEGASDAPAARLAEVTLAAMRAALSKLAFEEAAQLGKRALGVEGVGALPVRLRAELELQVGEALLRQGDAPEGRARCAEVAALATRTRDGELLARAALAYATELASGSVDPQMVALLRAALAANDEGDSALRVRLMARLAAALTPTTDPAELSEILGLTRAALQMVERLGDQPALLYALQFASTVGSLLPEQERIAMLERTVLSARELNQPLVLLHTLPASITALASLGECTRAASMLDDYTALLGDSAHPAHRLRHLLVSALLRALSGDFADAERLSDEAREIAQRSGALHLQRHFLFHRVTLAQLRNEPELLAREGGALTAHFGNVGGALSCVAWFLAGTGRRAEARALLDELDLTPLPFPSARIWELAVAAETCALLGDEELGARIYPLAVVSAERMFWSAAPGVVVGPSARALGALALVLGRVPEALQHYQRAIAFAQKMAAPALVAQCQEARARVLKRAACAPDMAPRPAATLPLGHASAIALRREGDVWTLRAPTGATLTLKHGKGLTYLECLLAQPGREVHVVELAGVEHRAGDAGPLLDQRAKAAYRARITALREEEDEAEQRGDSARAARAREEIEAIAEQLASAVGLGGRDRLAASQRERMRINVQRRVKDAIERIAALDPALGRYLSAAVKTGTTCVYQPL